VKFDFCLGEIHHQSLECNRCRKECAFYPTGLSTPPTPTPNENIAVYRILPSHEGISLLKSPFASFLTFYSIYRCKSDRILISVLVIYNIGNVSNIGRA
jgi:hypothetical protein